MADHILSARLALLDFLNAREELSFARIIDGQPQAQINEPMICVGKVRAKPQDIGFGGYLGTTLSTDLLSDNELSACVLNLKIDLFLLNTMSINTVAEHELDRMASRLINILEFESMPDNMEFIGFKMKKKCGLCYTNACVQKCVLSVRIPAIADIAEELEPIGEIDILPYLT